MKLELKHIAIAFSNKQQVLYFDDERELNQICNIVELREDEITISNGEYQYELGFDDVTIISRPLSDLTKEIEVNGEKFVPIEYFEENYTDHRVVFESPDCIILKEDYSLEQNVLGAPFVIIEKLFEWHFDVFLLIENGLAIDINTLNQ